MSLLDEIKAKCSPELLASRDTDAITAAVNAGRVRMDGVTKFASLGISERFPAIGPLPGALAAELVFQKLEGFAVQAKASTDPASRLLGGAIERQMGHLKGSGMAIGSSAVAQMLDIIAVSGGLTPQEVAALKSVAEVPDPVSELDVRRALFADNGDYLA